MAVVGETINSTRANENMQKTRLRSLKEETLTSLQLLLTNHTQPPVVVSSR